MKRNEKSSDLKFEITEKIGVIAENQSKWTKEVNKVIWNDSSEKFDIRDWDPEHEHMSRGITLHEDEMIKLYEILKNYFNE